MVAAVPIVIQVPGERAIPSSISFQLSSSRLPARLSAQYFQTSVPLPKVSPRQLPRSIDPPGTEIEGKFMLMAPISTPGVVLSHPPIRTAPSMG